MISEEFRRDRVLTDVDLLLLKGLFVLLIDLTS